MPANEANLAAAALVVALVALIIAVGQLLQQTLSTADGYRRCQPSVIGPWARKTRLKFRWSQFRFETFYTTPRINMASALISQHRASTQSSQAVFGLGIRVPNKNFGNELASWIPFLEFLHLKSFQSLSQMPAEQLEMEQIPRSELYEINLDSQSTSMLQQYSLPEYDYEERSWDFMPPDIARPLASTTVSDVAICAVRLGMRWKDFRPMDGSLIAEGHGQTLISTHVRSIGLILNYTFDTYKKQTDTDKSFWVPSGIADRFIFGIIPSPFKSLCESGLELGTVTDIYATFSIISPSGSLQTVLREYQESDPQRIPGISDLLCMTCPMLRIYGSPIDQVPQPFKSIFGPMSSASGMRAFHSCLHSFVSSRHKSASAQARWILQCCDKMNTRSQSWQSPSFLASNGGQVEVIDTYQRQFAKTALYIQDFCHATYTLPSMTDAEGIQGLSLYEALLLEHMHQAIVIAREVRQEISKIKTPRDDVYFEEMWKYFENDFSRLCSSLSGLVEKNVLIDLWLTLVYRGVCWAQCHSISTTSAHYTVSAKYYNSQMPVYIG